MLFFTFYSHEWIYVWESAWSQYEQRRFGHVVLIQCWKWGWCTRDLLLRKHVSVKTRKEGHSKPLPSNKSHTHHAAWYWRCIFLKSRQDSIGSIPEVLIYNPVVGDKLIPFPKPPKYHSFPWKRKTRPLPAICQTGPFPQWEGSE